MARMAAFWRRTARTILMIALVLGGELCAVSCANTDTLWRLDADKSGVVLEFEDMGNGTFRAQPKEGAGRGLELRNIDQSNDSVTVVNSLWLETDDTGSIRKGLLKRVVTSTLEKGTYKGSGAKWYVVTGGRVELDAKRFGRVTLTYRVGDGVQRLHGDVRPKKIAE